MCHVMCKNDEASDFLIGMSCSSLCGPYYEFSWFGNASTNILKEILSELRMRDMLPLAGKCRFSDAVIDYLPIRYGSKVDVSRKKNRTKDRVSALFCEPATGSIEGNAY